MKRVTKAQFVQDMMRDDRKVEVEPELIPPVEAFDHDFDLSLDELEAASPAVVSADLPGKDKPAVDSFEAVLEQQAVGGACDRAAGKYASTE